jgi:hypothetical protein
MVLGGVLCNGTCIGIALATIYVDRIKHRAEKSATSME